MQSSHGFIVFDITEPVEKPKVDLNKYETYSEEDLQIFANVVCAMLYAEKLRKQGILKGGPTIDKKAFQQLLEYCDERGIKPESQEEKLLMYLDIINGQLDHI